MDWQRLARANTHPLRISILEVLGLDGGRVLSPRDLSHELCAPLSRVNYHVTELAKSGLIELVGERAVRGATEHFYELADDRKPADGRRAPSASTSTAGSNGAGRKADGGVKPKKRRRPAGRKV